MRIFKGKKQKSNDTKKNNQLNTALENIPAEAVDKKAIKKRAKRINKKRGKNKYRFLGNVKMAPKLLASFLIIALLSSAAGVYATVSLLSNCGRSRGILRSTFGAGRQSEKDGRYVQPQRRGAGTSTVRINSWRKNIW